MESVLRSIAGAYRRFDDLYRSTFSARPFWAPAAERSGRLVLRMLERATGTALPEDECWGFGTRFRFLVGWYESETVAACRSLVRPGMKVLDIGAHCGYFTRLLSDLVGPTGAVYAFEADPGTYDFLARNTRFCANRNLVLVPTAVTDRTGTCEFHVMNGTGKHSLFDTSKELPYFKVKERITVQSITIDEFLAEQDSPEIDFVKIDVEGAEPRALEGMTETIARSPHVSMIVELHPSTLHAGGDDPAAFLTRLHSLGFDVQGIEPDGSFAPVDSLRLGEGPGYLNLVCRMRPRDGNRG